LPDYFDQILDGSLFMMRSLLTPALAVIYGLSFDTWEWFFSTGFCCLTDHHLTMWPLQLTMPCPASNDENKLRPG
jgi:hypothetical protein